MISRELIDLINSGRALCFAGCGISVDAGIPSWRGLFDDTAKKVEQTNHNISTARELANQNLLPQAFDELAKAESREKIHDYVQQTIRNSLEPCHYHRRIVDWPFRLYVTSNYDHLLESASKGNLASVGNRGNEVHKVTNNAKNIVWHIHGGASLNKDNSQLVVSDADYSDFYPSSNTADKLKALTEVYQSVYIGFGFNDPDITRILEFIGRHSNTARPDYAFLGFNCSQNSIAKECKKFRDKYNIQVIPYKIVDGKHHELGMILKGYKPFLLRKSISFGRESNQGELSYDPISTSLRVQSTLDLGELSSSKPNLRTTLLGAEILAYIRENPGCDLTALDYLVEAREISQREVHQCVAALKQQGVIDSKKTLNITAGHHQKTQEAQAALQLSEDMFIQSLRNRIEQISSELPLKSVRHTTNIVRSFLTELCKKQGLGVAQNLVTVDSKICSRRIVSLVRDSHKYLEKCRNSSEALCAIQVVVDILTRPIDAEAEFLGRICQAYFGQHLIGTVENLQKVDLSFIDKTCYILDAHVLICLLADGCNMFGATRRLLKDLLSCGGQITTTDLFIDEITEHAGWAIKLVEDFGENSAEIISALRCQGEYKPNQFLQGFFLGTSKDTSFAAYMRRAVSMSRGYIRSTDIKHHLENLGIQVLQFDEWEGYENDMLLRRTEIVDEISNRRTKNGTFRHSRQAKAEAEVALVVDQIRAGKLNPPGKESKDAFFVSSTRIVDELPKLDRRIGLLPEGLSAWIWSAQTTSAIHSEYVFEQLLWELSQRGIEFVDRNTILRKFHGVVEAGKSDLQITLSERKNYLVGKYGPNPENAFTDADPLDVPMLSNEANQAALQQMENQLKNAKERERLANKASRLSDKEKKEFETLKRKQLQKRKKEKSKQRANQGKRQKKKRKMK